MLQFALITVLVLSNANGEVLEVHKSGQVVAEWECKAQDGVYTEYAVDLDILARLTVCVETRTM